MFFIEIYRKDALAYMTLSLLLTTHIFKYSLSVLEATKMNYSFLFPFKVLLNWK